MRKRCPDCSADDGRGWRYSIWQTVVRRASISASYPKVGGNLGGSRMIRKWRATVLSVAAAVLASVVVPLWAAPVAAAANSNCVPVVIIPLRGSGETSVGMTSYPGVGKARRSINCSAKRRGATTCAVPQFWMSPRLEVRWGPKAIRQCRW